MSRDRRVNDLHRLARLADQMSRAEIARLARAEAACAGLRDRLDALNRRDFPDARSPAMARAALLHARWVEPRRKALAAELARAMATALDTREAARRAFGRAQVLGKLSAQAAERCRRLPGPRGDGGG